MTTIDINCAERNNLAAVAMVYEEPVFRHNKLPHGGSNHLSCVRLECRPATAPALRQGWRLHRGDCSLQVRKRFRDCEREHFPAQTFASFERGF
jgi:hypothetical protein